MPPPAPAGDPREGVRGDQRRRGGRSSQGAPPVAMEAAPRGARPPAMGPAWAELAGWPRPPAPPSASPSLWQGHLLVITPNRRGK
jgi:hypothetical protein